MRIALGIRYAGTAYHGWQSQADGQTVQDRLEEALMRFCAADTPVKTVCAGRTDTGVHALNQVVHLDTEIGRACVSWVRGVNRFLPSDIAVQWCREVSQDFHARNNAIGRSYEYIVLESPVRPSLEFCRVGWSWRPLDGDVMRRAAALLVGEHDFSAFRSSECQSPTPVKNLRSVQISKYGNYWRFEFEANAFLHHMIRNIMGTLVTVGAGNQPVSWVSEVLASRKRENAAPTFSPHGLYFIGPRYDLHWAVPEPQCFLGIQPTLDGL